MQKLLQTDKIPGSRDPPMVKTDPERPKMAYRPQLGESQHLQPKVLKWAEEATQRLQTPQGDQGGKMLAFTGSQKVHSLF